MSTDSSVRLLLVDGHALVRCALRLLLERQNGFHVVGEAGDLTQAVTQAAQCTPDIILLEPGRDTALLPDAIPRLMHAAGKQAHLLLVTDVTDPEVHRDAVRQGARGVVGKDRSADILFKAIQKVREGELWVERRLIADFIAKLDGNRLGEHMRIDSLTKREREVVALVSEGLKNKAIADRLALSDTTVRHHLTSVFSKLGVSDRLELVVYAFRHRLAKPPGNTGTNVPILIGALNVEP